MQTTVEFVEALKALKINGSYRRTAKMLGVKPQAVSNWIAGRSFFDDEVCLKAASELGLPPEYVVACVHAERAKTDSQRAVWEVIAAAFSRAALIILAVGVPALIGLSQLGGQV
jgi:DNA-binding transcriptional regulator YdaS (Cro superfamily)